MSKHLTYILAIGQPYKRSDPKMTCGVHMADVYFIRIVVCSSFKEEYTTIQVPFVPTISWLLVDRTAHSYISKQ